MSGCWMIKRSICLVKQISLLEIISTAVLLATVVVDLSGVFYAVDSATLQVTHRRTPAPYGMLAVPAVLPTLAAQWLDFNGFYNCAAEGATSIEELILQAVRSLSALRLRQSCGKEHFPKEAAFQQLFNEAFTTLLPPAVSVCPELNAFTKDKNGRVLSGELDFYVSDDRCWAIELLRNRDKINEHVRRFDPKCGKHRGVGYKGHLVVDCRGALITEVATMCWRTTQNMCASP